MVKDRADVQPKRKKSLPPDDGLGGLDSDPLMSGADKPKKKPKRRRINMQDIEEVCRVWNENVSTYAEAIVRTNEVNKEKEAQVREGREGSERSEQGKGRGAKRRVEGLLVIVVGVYCCRFAPALRPAFLHLSNLPPTLRSSPALQDVTSPNGVKKLQDRISSSNPKQSDLDKFKALHDEQEQALQESKDRFEGLGTEHGGEYVVGKPNEDQGEHLGVGDEMHFG